MKTQESLDPLHVSLLGLPGIVLHWQLISHLVKELGRLETAVVMLHDPDREERVNIRWHIGLPCMALVVIAGLLVEN